MGGGKGRGRVGLIFGNFQKVAILSLYIMIRRHCKIFKIDLSLLTVI